MIGTNNKCVIHICSHIKDSLNLLEHFTTQSTSTRYGNIHLPCLTPVSSTHHLNRPSQDSQYHHSRKIHSSITYSACRVKTRKPINCVCQAFRQVYAVISIYVSFKSSDILFPNNFRFSHTQTNTHTNKTLQIPCCVYRLTSNDTNII